MKRIFTILIGFVHDFAAGCWLATVLAVYRLDQVFPGSVDTANVQAARKGLPLDPLGEFHCDVPIEIFAGFLRCEKEWPRTK